MILDDSTLEWVGKQIDSLKEDYLNRLSDDSDALDKTLVECGVGTLNILKFKLGLD